MFKRVKDFVSDDTGGTAIEYGLIAALISIALIVSLTLISGKLTTLYAKIGTALTTAVSD